MLMRSFLFQIRILANSWKRGDRTCDNAVVALGCFCLHEVGSLILLRCVLGHGKAFLTILYTCTPPKSPVMLGECFWSFSVFFLCHIVGLKHLLLLVLVGCTEECEGNPFGLNFQYTVSHVCKDLKTQIASSSPLFAGPSLVQPTCIDDLKVHIFHWLPLDRYEFSGSMKIFCFPDLYAFMPAL